MDRLAFDEDALFSGNRIDRGRPLKFKLDGRVIEGFQGDSVLSAVLANGINEAGSNEFGPIALTPNFCPPIIISGTQSKNEILPMQRTPAINGVNYSLFRPDSAESAMSKSSSQNFIRSIFGKKTATLGYDFDEGAILNRSWYEQKAQKILSYDLVIIGGGIAGMSAARTALENGLRVALIDERADLGGDAEFFGAEEGEARPKDFVAQIKEQIGNAERLDIFNNARVTNLNERFARVNIVQTDQGTPVSTYLAFSGENFILANGVLERLPLFDGNRLPGVMSARAAYGLATNYGVWQGRTLAFCTASSPATRVALLAADMGVIVEKLADSRANPQSKFFEFAKAYGISLVTGTQIESASLDQQRKIEVAFGLAGGSGESVIANSSVDRLVVSGGWQPDLDLWHAVGGKTVWNDERQQLQAHGLVKNIWLAGACAGAENMTACENSGTQTVLELLGKEDMHQVFAHATNAYESDDGALQVGEQTAQNDECYLDVGHTLAKPKSLHKPGFWKGLLGPEQNSTNDALELDGEFSLIDVLAKVALNEIPAEFADIFAQERCGVRNELQQIVLKASSNTTPTLPTPGNPPRFLEGRFGKNPKIVTLDVPNDFSLEVGCLIFGDHENRSPDHSVGTIFNIADGILGLVQNGFGMPGTQLVVSNGTRTATTFVQSAKKLVSSPPAN